jgi:biopolymer transport protein ExbB/TolQ
MPATVRCPRCLAAVALAPESPAIFECPECRFRVPTTAPVDGAAQSQGTPEPITSAATAAPRAPAGQPLAQASDTSLPAKPRERVRGSEEEQAGTEVHVLLTSLIAIVPTALIYAAFWLWLRDQKIGQIVLERGWVPPATIYMATWAATILSWKYGTYLRQCKALALDLLPAEMGERIAHENAARLLLHLERIPARQRRTFVVSRLARILRFYRSGRSAEEVASNLRVLAEADAQAVESSYVMVKVLIWAIPILGFIGTVLGIGQSVDGFSSSMQGAQQMETIRTSLGQVTTGLAVAFDTTLIALVLSLLVMFPTSTLQKAEEKLLGAIDSYLDGHFLCRLHQGASDIRPVIEAVRAELARESAERREEIAGMRASLEAIVGGVGERMLAGWHVVDQQLQQREQASFERGERLLAALQETSKKQLEEFVRCSTVQVQEARTIIREVADAGRQVHAELARAQGEQIAASRASLLEVQDRIVALQDRNRETSGATVQALVQASASMERSASALGRRADEVATQIGEQLARLAARVETRTNAVAQSVTGRIQEQTSAFLEHERALADSVASLAKCLEDTEGKLAAVPVETMSRFEAEAKRLESSLGGVLAAARTSLEHGSGSLARQVEQSNAVQRTLLEQQRAFVEGLTSQISSALKHGREEMLKLRSRELVAIANECKAVSLVLAKCHAETNAQSKLLANLVAIQRQLPRGKLPPSNGGKPRRGSEAGDTTVKHGRKGGRVVVDDDVTDTSKAEPGLWRRLFGRG